MNDLVVTFYGGVTEWTCHFTQLEKSLNISEFLNRSTGNKVVVLAMLTPWILATKQEVPWQQPAAPGVGGCYIINHLHKE